MFDVIVCRERNESLNRDNMSEQFLRDKSETSISYTQDLLETSFENQLKTIRLQNINRIIVAHLNINSIRNKIELLSEAVTGNIDILMISETKIDE